MRVRARVRTCVHTRARACIGAGMGVLLGWFYFGSFLAVFSRFEAGLWGEMCNLSTGWLAACLAAFIAVFFCPRCGCLRLSELAHEDAIFVFCTEGRDYAWVGRLGWR